MLESHKLGKISRHLGVLSSAYHGVTSSPDPYNENRFAMLGSCLWEITACKCLFEFTDLPAQSLRRESSCPYSRAFV